jgi:hypothetical protein
MVKFLVAQILPLFTVINGRGNTVMVVTAVLEDKQPKELVPVTEYVVVTEGETTGDPLEKV